MYISALKEQAAAQIISVCILLIVRKQCVISRPRSLCISVRIQRRRLIVADIDFRRADCPAAVGQCAVKCHDRLLVIALLHIRYTKLTVRKLLLKTFIVTTGKHSYRESCRRCKLYNSFLVLHSDSVLLLCLLQHTTKYFTQKSIYDISSRDKYYKFRIFLIVIKFSPLCLCRHTTEKDPSCRIPPKKLFCRLQGFSTSYCE